MKKRLPVITLLMAILTSLTGLARARESTIDIVDKQIVGILSENFLNLDIPFRVQGAPKGVYLLQTKILDPYDHTVSSASGTLRLDRGAEKKFHLKLPIPAEVDRSKFFLYRLHYTLSGNNKELQSGIRSASEILTSVNLYVYAQKTYQAGSPASIRVLVTDESGKREIREGRLQVKLGGKKKSYNIFQGELRDFNRRDFGFNIPEDLVGEHELKVIAETSYGSQTITEKVNVKRSAKILLTTDKPIYQPSQTIHIRALSLKRGSLEPVAGSPLLFEVEDGKGNKVFKREVFTDKFGVAFADFRLADEVNYGRYRIKAILKEDSFAERGQEKTVEVKKYVLPKFKVQLKTNEEYYLPGETIKGRIQVNYFFGKPVKDAKVTVKAYEGRASEDADAFETLSLATNSEGACDFALRLPDELYAIDSSERGEIDLEISVTDSAEHEEKSKERIPVAESKILIEALPEGGKLVSNLENTLYVLTFYPNGKPAKTKIKLESIDGGGIVAYGEADESGICEIKFVPDGDAYYKISAVDESGAQVEEEITFDHIHKEGVLVRTDKPIYKVGEEVQLTILSTRKKGSLFVDFIRDQQTISTKTLELENGRAELRLPLSKDLQGTVLINVYAFDPNDFYTHWQRVIVVKPNVDLRIDVKPDKTNYKPGSEAKIDFRVWDNRGLPIAAALEVGLVDEAVFALAEKLPGLARSFFLLEAELLRPRYQIKSFSLPYVLSKYEDRGGLRSANASLSAVSYEGQNRFLLRKEQIESQIKIRKLREAFQPRIDKDLYTLLKGMGERKIPYSKIDKFMLEEKIKDPWGEDYYFKVSEIDVGVDKKLYYLSLASKGPDRIKGTSDDIFSSVYLGVEAVFTKGGNEHKYLAKAGSIHGIVRDPTGGVIPGATLTLMGLNTYQVRNVVTDDMGGYLFVGLPPGFYALRVELPGFKTAVYRDIKLQEGYSIKLDVTLEVGAVCETVTVSSGAPAILAMSASTVFLTAEVQEPYVRSYFPETLYYNPSLITDETGHAHINLKLADSITTWRISLLASSLNGELADKTGELNVFQDFFVDLDLPISLTQDDEVSIPVAIHLKLVSDEWFSLVGDVAEKSLEIDKDSVSVEHFRIKANKIGEHKITVYAYGSQLSDAVTREIEVLPNGKEFNTSYSDVLKEGMAEKEIVIPTEAVADASKILVKIYPGFFSQALEGIDGLLRMPYG